MNFPKYVVFSVFAVYLISCNRAEKLQTNDTALTHIEDSKSEIDTLITFLEQIDAPKDSVKNETDFKIKVLYTQKQNLMYEGSLFVFSLLNETSYCLTKTGNIVFQNDKINLHISKDKVFLTPTDIECVAENKTEFTCCVNEDVYHAETILNLADFEKTFRYNKEYGEVNITNGIPRCGDTGRNKLTIIRNGKMLSFPYLNNMILIKKETNNPTKPILILLDFRCCTNELKIYKIY